MTNGEEPTSEWGDPGFPPWFARVTGVGQSLRQSLVVPVLAIITALIIGGIIPEDDAQQLQAQGVKAVFTPKDVDMNAIMATLVDIIRRDNGLEALA